MKKKKVLLILGIAVVMLLLGYLGDFVVSFPSPEEERWLNMKKFFYDGDTYTAKLFVKMADTYGGILSGEDQQTYIFDLRSKEAYDAGHIEGAINIDAEKADLEYIIDRIPTDYTIYVIGETDEEAKAFITRLKEADEEEYSLYAIIGGYEELRETRGIKKYITTRPGCFGDFSRTGATKKFKELLSKQEGK